MTLQKVWLGACVPVCVSVLIIKGPVYHQKKRYVTPRKINMEPENTPLEKENHLPNHHFQVLC